jgi:hypothetical protein
MILVLVAVARNIKIAMEKKRDEESIIVKSIVF